MKTKKLVLNGVFIALHVVLCYISLNFGNMVISLAGIPIILGGLMFGPLAGLEIGLIGSFLNQVLKYGITATTILWIIPVGVRGLMVGAYAKRKKYKMNARQIGFIIVLSALVLTTLNTVVMYIDSKIYGYYSYAYVFGAIILRYISAIVTSVIFTIIVPFMMKHLKVFRETDGGRINRSSEKNKI